MKVPGYIGEDAKMVVDICPTKKELLVLTKVEVE
jgi:hypothetical protein